MSGDDDESGWQLTESDPGVFTELLKSLGVPLIVDDLYTLDAPALATLHPIHALIFLFKWIASPATDNAASPGGGTYDPAFPGFFAHQVVNNACATLAVLNALGNIPAVRSSTPSDSGESGCGPELAQLFDFTADLDPQTRGLAITSSDALRAAHNALSPPSAVSLAELGLPRTQAEDAYHFVVYVPVAGALYELDGLKQFAVRHGAVDEAGEAESRGEGWLARAREVIERRIGTYPPGSLHFNLQAIHADPLPRLRAELATLQSQSPSASGDSTAEKFHLQEQIDAEETKRQRWALENSLRRHNHLGLIHALVLALAKAGKLDVAKQGARTKLQERIEKRRKEGKGADMDED